MPLIAPVEIRPADEVGPVHFIAIGGAGMSGIARLYAELGVPVSGSDQQDSATLQELAEAGITTYVGHDPAHLGPARVVVVSTAVRETNPELAEARRLGLTVWHRSAALAALMLGQRAVSITGTHGKTTTTGMTAVVLDRCGLDPSYVIGSPLAASGRSSHLGTGDVFVIEADESDGSFLQYPSRVVVITNIEADHLDNWGTPEAYARGFADLARLDGVEVVVLGADDPGTRPLAASLRAEGRRVLTFGRSEAADVRLTELRYEGVRSFAKVTAEGDEGLLELRVPGEHNLLNAAAAYAVGRALEVPGPDLRAAAATFTGTHRRFQLVGNVDGIEIVDDYAHHPTEVTATLRAARDLVRGDGRRLVACFQPHLFTRTRDFAAEFGAALALADEILVLGIYPAREDPIPGVTGRLVAEAAAALVGESRVRYLEAKDDAAAALAGFVSPGDLVLTLGAGDVTTVGPALAERLAAEVGR